MELSATVAKTSRSPSLSADPPIKGEPDEWKGLTDPKERRRRQNRINQRAYRKRKQAERTDGPKSRLTIDRERNASALQTISNSSSTSPEVEEEGESSDNSLTLRQPHWHVTTKPSGHCLKPANLDRILEQFSSTAYQSYILGFPTADHLLTLSKVNVFRAFASNMTLLGMAPGSAYMLDDAISPFSLTQPYHVDESKLPVALRPTKIQQTLPHHPWLDFFPHPRMRDNLVEAEDHFDDEQLCVDIMGFWDSSKYPCGLLVWGEPSDPDNWEVTEEFLRKYPWILRGCNSLLQATNRWRAQRGENMIFRYL